MPIRRCVRRHFRHGAGLKHDMSGIKADMADIETDVPSHSDTLNVLLEDVREIRAAINNAASRPILPVLRLRTAPAWWEATPSAL